MCPFFYVSASCRCTAAGGQRPAQISKIKKKKYIYLSKFNSKWMSFSYVFLFASEIRKHTFCKKNTTVANVAPYWCEQTAASTSSQENRQHPVSPSGCDEIADQLLRAASLFDLQKSRVYPGIFCVLRKTWHKNKSSRICRPYF